MKIMHYEQPLGTLSLSAPVTLLTDSSISRNHRPLFVPPHHDDWTMTISPIFRVSRLGKFVSSKFARRYYNAVSLMARLRPSKALQLPASATDTAFDSAVVVGDWIELNETGETLRLNIDGCLKREVDIDMPTIDCIVSWLSSYFMIKHGDIIVPGDLPDRLDVSLDTSISLTANDITTLDFKIK